MSVTITFVGSGESFGSGGRFNTCFLVDTPGFRFCIDFGATSLVALNAQRGAGAVQSLEVLSLPARLANAACSTGKRSAPRKSSRRANVACPW